MQEVVINLLISLFGFLCALAQVVLVVLHKEAIGSLGDMRYLLSSLLVFTTGAAYVLTVFYVLSPEHIDIEADTQGKPSPFGGRKITHQSAAVASCFAIALALFIMYTQTIPS